MISFLFVTTILTLNSHNKPLTRQLPLHNYDRHYLNTQKVKTLDTKIAGGFCLERSEVLRSLRHYLRVQSQGHYTIDRLEERGVERGSSRRSCLKGRERAIVSQTNIRTISKATLGKLLRDGVKRITVGFSECIDIILTLSLPQHRLKTTNRTARF